MFDVDQIRSRVQEHNQNLLSRDEITFMFTDHYCVQVSDNYQL